MNHDPLEEYYDRVNDGQGTSILEDELASALADARKAIDNAYDAILDYLNGDAQDGTLREVGKELEHERVSRNG